jgi:hypothetical protein
MILLIKKFYISRDIIFIENKSYFKNDSEIKIQWNPHTIDQAELILPQLYSFDIMENRKFRIDDHEDESIN